MKLEGRNFENAILYFHKDEFTFLKKKFAIGIDYNENVNSYLIGFAFLHDIEKNFDKKKARMMVFGRIKKDHKNCIPIKSTILQKYKGTIDFLKNVFEKSGIGEAKQPFVRNVDFIVNKFFETIKELS